MKKYMKNLYPNNNNPFSGATVADFRKKFIYPSEGKVRFQICIDKNNQIYEINRSYAQIIKDTETNKRFVKVSIGERPRRLFDRIHGRPFQLASIWIDQEVANIEELETFSESE